MIFAPHVFDDIIVSKEIAAGVPNTEIWDFGYYAFDHCEHAISFYQNAKFVITMRGHGQIIPIAFNTPVISLSNHPKHIGLMKELNLSDYNVNLSDADFYEDLLKKIVKLEQNYSCLVDKYEAINRDLCKKSESEWNKITSLLQ